ncbi:peptidase S41 [Bacteroidia bacterium]|nr:peptidase S41 [Bacteroidia bacterium]
MKRNIVYLLGLILLLGFVACDDAEDTSGTTTANSAKINNWIYQNMKTYYLWTNNIPASTDKSLAPDDYFESLLYKNEDRFSWIQENFTDLLNMLSGVQREAGYDFQLMRVKNSNAVFGNITYVKPNSPASNAGLQRGDIFVAIDDQRLTMDNYRTLIGKMGSQHQLDIAEYDDLQQITKTVPLSVVVYKENPILLDTVYWIDGKKIGYFVYNFFARDNGDNTYTYERELNSLFGEFKSAGIDELIIDLRYNGGGAVTTSIALASMVSNRTHSDIFGIGQYNGKHKNNDKDYFVDKISDTNTPINHLGIDKLHVIATRGTASASELLINGLRPYMEVVIIGDTTYGKNVGSYTIYEKNNPANKWGMQPIVVKYANKDEFSDYGKGFVPDVLANETNEGFPLKQLGDTDEVMLKATIDKIFGRTPIVASARGLAKSLHNTADFKIIATSWDRMPARRNMYIEMKEGNKDE